MVLECYDHRKPVNMVKGSAYKNYLMMTDTFLSSLCIAFCLSVWCHLTKTQHLKIIHISSSTVPGMFLKWHICESFHAICLSASCKSTKLWQVGSLQRQVAFFIILSGFFRKYSPSFWQVQTIWAPAKGSAINHLWGGGGVLQKKD